MRNRSFARRVALLTLVSVMVLLLAVTSASATPSAFDALTPGDAAAPGPVFDEVADIIPITWEASTSDVTPTPGTITYEFNVEINGAPAIGIDVPPGQLTGTTTLTWVPGGAEAAQLAGAIVDGDYEWYLIATDDNATPGTPGDDTTATSTSRFFQVDLPPTEAPAAFELTGPANGAYFRSGLNAVPLAWDAATDAESYDVVVFKISNNTRIGEVVNQTLNPTEAGCEADATCTFNANIDVAAGGSGMYSWTVVAGNTIGDTEASNGPWFFTANTDPIDLVTNGDFEEPAGNPNAQIPTGWTLINGNGDRRECRPAKLPSNATGCAYKATPGVLSALVQTVLGVKKYAVDGDDTITVSGDFQSSGATPASSKIKVTLIFTSPAQPRQIINVALPAAATGADFVALTPSIYNILDENPGRVVKKVKIQIQATSKFYIDNLSVTIDPVPAPPLASGLVPLPAAP
jgi:hypothetical protein